VPGPADCSGWHTSAVTIHWTASADATSSTCSLVETVSDQGVSNRSCTVSSATTKITASLAVKIDWTPPTVTGAAAARPADHRGWYRRPVDVAFFGNDLISGIASCTRATYAGPDGPSAIVPGTCTDNAGNVSAPSPFALRFDATPPALGIRSARAGDRVVRVRWRIPADATSLEVVRRPGRRGHASTVVHRGGGSRLVDRRVRNGRRYRYTLRAVDRAGNAASTSAWVVPGPRLTGPADGAALSAPPRLTWTRLRGARYYNVQLFRGAHKVLSAWPRRPQLALRRSWRYAGKRRHLRPGRYRWYVWPGRGQPAQRRYGALIGHARFVVRRR
jgi:hypothetical protein